MKIDISSFENVEDFLEYCILNSQTERALFSMQHINCLYELAGIPPYQTIGNEQLFGSICYGDMEEIIDIIEDRKNSIEGRFEREDFRRTSEKLREVRKNVLYLNDYR